MRKKISHKHLQAARQQNKIKIKWKQNSQILVTALLSLINKKIQLYI